MALTRLGPDFRFQTRVLADALPDSQGRVRGPLRLIGGGDPNLSARAIPYRTGANSGNPLAAIEDLADQIAARGVKRVDGGIVGDDTWYLWEPYGSGWGIDDPESDYGAAVSALAIHDNALMLSIRPGARAGEPAALSFGPALEYYQHRKPRASLWGLRHGGELGAARIRFARLPGSRKLRLWGTIPLGGHASSWCWASKIRRSMRRWRCGNALEERGIAVEGAAEARHEFPNQVDEATSG